MVSSVRDVGEGFGGNGWKMGVGYGWDEGIAIGRGREWVA